MSQHDGPTGDPRGIPFVGRSMYGRQTGSAVPARLDAVERRSGLGSGSGDASRMRKAKEQRLKSSLYYFRCVFPWCYVIENIYARK